MQRSAKGGRKPGPTPRWGERQQVSVKLPVPHRAVYEQEAARLGISLNEYLVRFLAREHGLLRSDQVEEQEQLPLGA
ncbi:hypothetical protein [Pseudonocardia sp. H11422]|uniref:hypothetical protein n=1 Tax=Pseudonocardia sp. H11422 TaxID=2835866 RepID=UPI001BDBCC66|nr:hypothetical protein [Pseudonocardia sp. H11422]